MDDDAKYWSERRAFAARQMDRATRLDAVARRGWKAVALFTAALPCWGFSFSVSWLMVPGAGLTLAGLYLLHTAQRRGNAVMREINDEERRNRETRLGDGRRL